MAELTRREFLIIGAKLAALMGLSRSLVPQVAEALETLAQGTQPVLWLQGQSCSGCSVSLLNADSPDPLTLLTQYISLRFHSTLSAATGEVALDIIDKTVKNDKYFLVVEGAIPLGMPHACNFGGHPLEVGLKAAAQNAAAIIAIGTCASFGGIPAAENNPTGAASVETFLEKNSIAKPLINIPGCPCHPDWFLGTLVHVLRFGLPPLDNKKRPLAFFSKTIHEQCPRFRDYEEEIFAQSYSDSGCLFNLGCLGPQTHADCTTRNWNNGVNTCISAGAPCIGCAWEKFARKSNLPMSRKTEK